MLFFSNYCSYCKDLLSEIVKKGIRQKFILICVEKHQVPPFVDRVPFIMTMDKNIVLEENITIFVDMLINEEMKNNDEGIVAYASYSKGQLGNDYCSVVDNDDGICGNKNKNISDVLGYVFLDEDNQMNNSNSSSSQFVEPSSHPSSQIANKQFDVYNTDVYNQGGGGGGFPTMQSSMPQQNAPVYDPRVFQIEENTPAVKLPFKQISVGKGTKMNDSVYDQLLKQRSEDMEAFKRGCQQGY